ncbi:MAG: protein translocase subunit SecF [Clostridia bacterium]|nr:protein translocase subunit SecF [Clostridia bacterium]
MANKYINTKKWFKISVAIYAILFIAGIVFTVIGGVKLDINFSGGTRITYSYTGEVDEAAAKDVIKGVIDKDFTTGKNTSIAGDTKTLSISLAGKDSLAAEKQEALTDALVKEFKDNNIELYDSNSVSPSVAGSFLVKALVAVLITAILVIIYVGFRFRRIGGVSAALTALCALVIDIFASFFACAIFGLQIDANYMAVVLTILGYSLNDTIVIYDRVRENKRMYPDLPVSENMDMSITGIITRNIVTTLTTTIAVLTIIVVAEIYGLVSLRTFAIPMVFGLISGCFSSLFVAGPLWVRWREFRDSKKAK